PTPPVASTVRSSRKESPPRVPLSAKSAVADQLPLRPGLAGLPRVRQRTADNAGSPPPACARTSALERRPLLLTPGARAPGRFTRRPCAVSASLPGLPAAVLGCD